jgi:hypothetical protein
MDIRTGQSALRPELTARTPEHEADGCPLDCGVRPKMTADYTGHVTQFHQHEST